MRSYTQLTREQRYQISALLKMDHNHTEIADLLHVHKSTIGREINRNRGWRGYRPRQADQKACERRKIRPGGLPVCLGTRWMYSCVKTGVRSKYRDG